MCVGQEGKNLPNANRKACLNEWWCMESSEEEDLSVVVSPRFVFVVFCSPGEVCDHNFSM